ncbi:MAG: hypothetical protein JW791_04245 [Nanoarchaeota archaeon]|nr:hypothetical protein [Nanoarchaeota archaeon]
MEVDEAVEELSKLKIFDPDKFKEKLRLLKAKQPHIYYEVIKIMNISDADVKPVKTASGDPYNLFKKDTSKIKKDAGGFGIAVIATILIGLVGIGAVFIFLLDVPLEAPTTFNANESVSLGYQLFNSINNLYLQYSFDYNTTSSTITYSTGREYYKISSDYYTSAIYFNTFNCAPVCSLITTDGYIISRKEGDTLYFGIYSDCSVCSCDVYSMTDVNDFWAQGVLNYYDELYYYVNNGYVINSDREDVWTINGEQCAPMFFDIRVPNELKNSGFFGEELTSLRYELCLNNEGVPLALAKNSDYETYSDTFVAFLESMDDIIGLSTISDKTLNEWDSEQLTCVSI